MCCTEGALTAVHGGPWYVRLLLIVCPQLLRSSAKAVAHTVQLTAGWQLLASSITHSMYWGRSPAQLEARAHTAAWDSRVSLTPTTTTSPAATAADGATTGTGWCAATPAARIV